MWRLVTCLVAVVTFTACSSSTPAESQPSDSASAEMMAAALTELITRNHTFGAGPSPFNEYLIELNTLPISLQVTPSSPDSVEKSSDSRRRLTDRERSAIEADISEHGHVQWIEEADDWRVGLELKIEGSVILGVDTPRLEGDGALVPVSLWCGGDCATWFTYRLELIDGTWQVVGIEGPVSIS